MMGSDKICDDVKWWRRWRLLLLLLTSHFSFLTPLSFAQQMQVADFAKQKKGPLNMNHVVTDKQLAIIDLATGEKGFKFLADGKTPVEAEENDGMLTLKAADKTAFLVIQHPDYGQLTWKVPQKKGLRKKKHYQATLLTFSPEKEYQMQKQWVIFDIQPQNAILTVDSTMTLTHGQTQHYLSIGKHTYLVESPFHQQEEGTFELTDEERLTMKVALQPIYSYLTVKTPMEECDIYVDGLPIGRGEGTSGRLYEGSHRLIVAKDGLHYYEGDVTIGRSEKKRVELTADDLHPIVRQLPTARTEVPCEEKLDDGLAQDEQPAPAVRAPVTIKALDEHTSIWVNRELKGYGSWEGTLDAGFYLISTEKEGVESRSATLWVADDTPKNIELLAPMNDYGMMNVHCNEIGAKVYVNGRLAGVTPCVVKNLPVDKNYLVKLVKAGFFQAEKEIRVIGNDLVDVSMTLKRR